LESNVLASPLSVINEILYHLQTLSELLLDEVDERGITSHQLTTERRICKEALQTIRVLIPTPPFEANRRQEPRSSCPDGAKQPAKERPSTAWTK
jgi:hypothetical protein